MKTQFKSFMFGIFVACICITTTFASPIIKKLEAVYSIQGIKINGKNMAFTEANKPFVVDGVTFLPVRAIAEALDKEVNFDGTTGMVEIYDKSTQKSIPMTMDMVSGEVQGLGLLGVYDWDVANKDNAGKTHETGVAFSTNLYDKSYGEKASVYPVKTAVHIALGGAYSQLKGELVLTAESKSFYNTYKLTILGDGVVLETVEIKTGTAPIKLDLETTGIKTLSIQFETVTSNIVMESVKYGLVDVMLIE